MPESSRRLIGEILASSGPRKTPNTQGSPVAPELGEDAGGVLFQDTGSLCIWTADGMSDADSLTAFSSARLAQDLGRLFVDCLLHSGDGNPPAPQAMVDSLLTGIKDEWGPRLQQANVQSELSKPLKTQPAATGTTRFLECASTFSAAYLNRDGRAQVLSVGDSYLAVHRQGATGFFAFKKGAITVRVYLENTGPRLEVLAPPVETYSYEDVDLILLGTDGIKDSFQWLNQSLGSNFNITPSQYRKLKTLLSEGRPATQDDKTLGVAARIHES